MTDLPPPPGLSAVSALGDEVRRRLFEYVRHSAEPVTRDQAAAALDLPRSTVSLQLDALAGHGLLNVEFRKVSGKSGPGSGRPAKVYAAAVPEVSASVPERSYSLAGELLATAVEESARTSRPAHELVAEVARAKGAELGSVAGGLEATLAAAGYRPLPDAAGFALGNCPFHLLARSHTQTVCGLNLALLEGMLDGCADQGHRVAADPDGPFCCARINRRRPA
jgi:predicted ArsR family transcriptional regulator